MSRYKEMWSLKHAHTIEEYISFYQQGIDASCISIDKEKELDLFSYLKTRIDNDDTMFLYAVCLERGTGTNKQLNKAIEIYEFLAKKGHAAAQCFLGDCYFKGEGIKQNSLIAIEWYEKAANQNNAMAQNNLGCCYERGLVVEKNPAKAVELYKQSFEQGYDFAANNLGCCYFNGKGVEHDLDKAIYLFKKGIDNCDPMAYINLKKLELIIELYNKATSGDKISQYNLGTKYNEGAELPYSISHAIYWLEKSAMQDYSQAQYKLGELYLESEHKDLCKSFEWTYKAANNGYAAAQYQLAFLYHNGYGIEKTPKETFYWYSEAAKQNHTLAMTNLAWCYANGYGIKKNMSKAIYYYKVTAELGDTIAQYSLGCCYFNGKGVEYDFDKAIYWFEKSAKEGNLESHNALNKLHNIIELKKKAEIGDSIAAYKMAQNYLTGTIVPLNNYQAFDWCYKSAIAGNIDACYLLGELYTRGKGVDVNNEKAFYWYLKAAERDNSYAQYEVAQCYYNGLGVAKDNNEAFEWFYRSAMQGNKCAQHNLIYCYAHGVGVLKDLEMASVWYDVEKNQPANEKPILKLTSSEVESLNKIRHNERLKFINENISENILNSTINLDDNVSSKYKITTNKKMKLINATNCLNEVNVDWLPEVATNEYLFISYSHADYKKVYQDIFSFQVYGKSVWYDRAMPPSQNWEETAEMYIYKFSCKGIVFYISLNSIISASIHKEIECAMKHGKSILVISLPINEHYFYNGEDMYGKEVSPYKMIEVLKDNGHEISQDKEDFIFKYFNDKVIYVPYSSKIDKKIEEISKLKKPKLFVIDDFGPEVEIAKVNDSDIKRVRESDFLFDEEGICVERIGECALTNCFMLETVELPKKIYRLDRYCFYRCLSLQEINLNYLKSIGASAFCQCESLVFISLDQIISIEENAFLGCLKLKKVSFGKHLKTIGKCAFCQCVSLVQISLPASVEKISDDSFSLCFNLKYVYYAGTKQQWQSIVSSSAFSSSYDITIYCVDGNIVIKTSQKYIRFLN